MSGEAPLLSLKVTGKVVEWRGPAPFLFLPIPAIHSAEVRYAARQASYGWGVVPVRARIGTLDFTTSLFPRDGSYLLPIKVAVQRARRIGLGDTITAAFEVNLPGTSRCAAR